MPFFPLMCVRPRCIGSLCVPLAHCLSAHCSTRYRDQSFKQAGCCELKLGLDGYGAALCGSLCKTHMGSARTLVVGVTYSTASHEFEIRRPCLTASHTMEAEGQYVVVPSEYEALIHRGYNGRIQEIQEKAEQQLCQLQERCRQVGAAVGAQGAVAGSP